jgi:Variant SH3 domain/Sel1 repeat
MKSATFGLSRVLYEPPPATPHRRGGYWGNVRGEALREYRAERQNGSDRLDGPWTVFPADGRYSCHPAGKRYRIKYTEGPGDRAWMEQCDRNYLARLAALQAQQSQIPATKATLSEVSLAALQGNADAQFQLGQRYAGGLDVKLDKKEALKWFEKAAAQGHAPAQLALGRVYEKGEGKKKSLSSAQKWYAKATAQHAPHAKKRLARVKQRIANRRKSSSHHSSATQSSTSHSSGGSERRPTAAQVVSALKTGAKAIPATAGENIPAGYQVHSEVQSVKTDPNYSLHTPQAGSSSAGTGGYLLDSPSGPPPPIPTAMLVAEVLYPFQGASAEELTLPAGEKVRVVDRVTPDWWRCEHEGQSGLVPSKYLRTLSSAQVPSALPAGYTDYTTPTSGEALGTTGIFSAAPATPDSVASNQASAPEASQGYQSYSIQ